MEQEIQEDRIEREKRIDAVIKNYEDEARRVINNFIKDYDLDDDYEISEFTLTCVTQFLMDWHFYEVNLPSGEWTKVIKMYMNIIDIDFEYLENMHAYLRRMH